MKKIALATASLLAAATICATPTWAAEPPAGLAEQESQGIAYLTGGVDLDESTALKAAMSRYPLVVEVYRDAGGKNEYTASAELTITTPKGEPVFSTTMQGPFALLRLQPGRYAVKVVYDGQAKQRDVTVRERGSTRANFVFGAH